MYICIKFLVFRYIHHGGLNYSLKECYTQLQAYMKSFEKSVLKFGWGDF